MPPRHSRLLLGLSLAALVAFYLYLPPLRPNLSNLQSKIVDRLPASTKSDDRIWLKDQTNYRQDVFMELMGQHEELNGTEWFRNPKFEIDPLVYRPRKLKEPIKILFFAELEGQDRTLKS